MLRAQVNYIKKKLKKKENRKKKKKTERREEKGEKTHLPRFHQQVGRASYVL